MRQPVLPIMIGTAAGAVASAVLYHFLWLKAFPGVQSPLATFGLGLMAFTGALFGGLGASLELPPRELAKYWRILIAVSAVLVIEILVSWKMGAQGQRWNRYDFFLGSFLLGYLIRRVYAAVIGEQPAKKSLSRDEIG